MKYGVVILAGGKSRRMGKNKAELCLNGVRFLDKLVYELSGSGEMMVSVDDENRHPEIEYPMVSDLFEDCGPMGGLYSALKKCSSDALVVVPCDVPLFSKTVAQRMCECLGEETDAVIAITQDGREHPLCGVYKKSCIERMEKCLCEQNYRMQYMLGGLRVKRFHAGEDSWRFKNINTPDEYQKLSISNCLAISGRKNSGKTTLIERLIPLLSKKGLKIATVKHDGHSYEPDVPGTDSYRFFKAGAETSVIYDGEKYSVTRRERVTEEGMVNLISDADIILLEGFKWSEYPKIEMVRKETQKEPIEKLKGRIAYVADREICQSMERLPVFEIDDVAKIAEFIINAYETGRLKERWKSEEDW